MKNYISDRYTQRLTPSRPRSFTPKLNNNGIHNCDLLNLKTSIDITQYKPLITRPMSVGLNKHKRASLSGIQSPLPFGFMMTSTAFTKTSTIQYNNPQQCSYARFPSRHKYIKGKKRPISINTKQLINQCTLRKKFQFELRARQQKQKLQNQQRFQRIKQKYLQLSQNKRSTFDKICKPKKQTVNKNKYNMNQGLVLTPWNNQETI